MIQAVLSAFLSMTIGVESAWRVLHGGEIEYMVRLDPALVRDLADLPPEERYVESVIPREVQRIDRLRIELAAAPPSSPSSLAPVPSSSTGSAERPAGSAENKGNGGEGLVAVPQNPGSRSLRIDPGENVSAVVRTDDLLEADAPAGRAARGADQRSVGEIPAEGGSDMPAAPEIGGGRRSTVDSQPDRSHLRETRPVPVEGPLSSGTPVNGASSPSDAGQDEPSRSNSRWQQEISFATAFPAVVAMLCCSLGGNLFQGWVYASLRARHRAAVRKAGELQSLAALAQRIDSSAH